MVGSSRFELQRLEFRVHGLAISHRMPCATFVPLFAVEACDRAVWNGMIRYVADGHKTRIWRGDSLDLTDSFQVGQKGQNTIPLPPPFSLQVERHSQRERQTARQMRECWGPSALENIRFGAPGRDDSG
jgi:hypothetical protein